MKRFLISFFLCAVNICVYGQIYINNRYNFGFQDLGVDVCKVSSGFVLVSAESEIGGLQWNLRFITLNNNANIISNHSYGSTANYYVYQGSLVQIDSTSYAIGGGKLDNGGLKGYLMKLNSNGDSIWTKTFSGIADKQFFDCKKSSDGGFILAGITYEFDPNGDALLLKTDSLGDFQWENHYGGNLYDDAKSVIQTTDGGYLFVGKKRTPSFWSEGFIVKTDNNGSWQWNREYGGPFEDAFESCIQSTLDSFIYVTGNYCSNSFNPPFGNNFNKPYVVKIDLFGDTVWTKVYGDSLYSLSITSVSESIIQNAIILAGNSPDIITGRQSGLIMNIDTSGNAQWSKQFRNIYGLNSANILRELFILSTGNILAIGNVYPNVPDTGNVDTWLLAVDSLGCLLPNCTSSINEIALEDILNIYPNPSIKEVTIKFDSIFKNGIIKIFDYRGILISSNKISSNNEPITKSFDKPGIYTAVVESGKKIIIQKFVIIPM